MKETNFGLTMPFSFQSLGRRRGATPATGQRVFDGHAFRCSCIIQLYSSLKIILTNIYLANADLVPFGSFVHESIRVSQLFYAGAICSMACNIFRCVRNVRHFTVSQCFRVSSLRYRQYNERYGVESATSSVTVHGASLCIYSFIQCTRTAFLD